MSMKKLFYIAAIIFLFTFFPVHAQDVATPENQSTITIWNPVSLTENYLTDYYFKEGNETVFHGKVVNYDYNAVHQVLISVEIYNENRKRVSQVFYYPITLNPSHYVNVELISPRALTAGRYYYAVGIYDAQTFKQMGWFPAYQQFTVYK